MAVTNPNFNPSGNLKVDLIKNTVAELEAVIRDNTPEGRRQSIALTHLETCAMFAVKAAVANNE